MGNELLATYHYKGRIYDVYGCWDKETKENSFDFYDIEERDGECLNLGDPYYTFPSRDDVIELVEAAA